MSVREAIAELRAAAEARIRCEDRYRAALRLAVDADVSEELIADVLLAVRGAGADPTVFGSAERDAVAARRRLKGPRENPRRPSSRTAE